MGDLEESLSQRHSAGSLIQSCLPAAGLPGCPAVLRRWLQGICGQHGPGVPGQAGTGAEAAGCGGVLVHGGRATLCQAALAHVAVMLGTNGLAVPGCPVAADFGDRRPPQGAPQLLRTELSHLRN